MKWQYVSFLVFISFQVFGRVSKADTIDVYWVYYNDTVWAKLNEYSSTTVLKLHNNLIKEKDSISIKYTSDTPCRDCTNDITIKDGKGDVVLYLKSRGSWIPFSFSLRSLKLHYSPKYSFYYNG